MGTWLKGLKGLKGLKEGEGEFELPAKELDLIFESHLVGEHLEDE